LGPLSRLTGVPKVNDYRPGGGRTLRSVLAALAPRLWLGHLLAIVLVVAALLLGLWQLDAWQTRRADEARDLTRSAAVPLSDVMGPDDPFPGRSVGQPVELAGSWLSDGTVFISGREHDGKDGFWMVTPLAVGDDASAPALPVVLGWVADPATAPPPPQGEASVTGWLQPPEGTGERDDDPSDDVLPQLRIADIVQHVDQDLYGAYAIAQDGIDGLPAADLAALPDAGRFTAVRNLLYAIEWWFFGAFAVLIWWRWLGEQLAPIPDAPAEEDEEQPDTVKA
jgi:surfeit locus 1 family protein